MEEPEQQIPIWFFIGVLLSLYGVLIFAAGLHNWLRPPPPAHRVALWSLHADVWWGILLALFGALYVVRFRPGRKR